MTFRMEPQELWPSIDKWALIKLKGNCLRNLKRKGGKKSLPSIHPTEDYYTKYINNSKNGQENNRVLKWAMNVNREF